RKQYLRDQQQGHQHDRLHCGLGESGDRQPDAGCREGKKDKSDQLPLERTMDTESSDRNRRIDQERLNRGKSRHPDEFAGQITPPAEPDEAFPAIDWQFFNDFLCRVTAPEPKRPNIREKSSSWASLAAQATSAPMIIGCARRIIRFLLSAMKIANWRCNRIGSENERFLFLRDGGGGASCSRSAAGGGSN